MSVRNAPDPRTVGERELAVGQRVWVDTGTSFGVLVGTLKRTTRKSATVYLTPTIEVRVLFGRGQIGRA